MQQYCVERKNIEPQTTSGILLFSEGKTRRKSEFYKEEAVSEPYQYQSERTV